MRGKKKKKKLHTLCEVLNDRLGHNFALPVRTIGLESGRLWYWHHWRGAIYGCGGRIDEPGAVEFGHDLEEVYRGGDIVVVVRQWYLG
jgi:hypothetical protein